MNDFYEIKGFKPWVWEEHQRSRDWLAHHVNEGDIVITHHLPSPACVDPKYMTSKLNPFFVADCEDIIVVNRPSVWINGHSHSTHDFQFCRTRMICNPFGYPRESTGFNPNLVIEV